MDVLVKTIKSLSKKEIINYKIQANRLNNNENRKDLALFELLKNNKNCDVDNDKNRIKLYGASANNKTYNKLKERLLLEINNSLVQFYFHETDTNYIYSELSLFKLFIARNEFSVANYHLQKAEKRAITINDFLLLDVIYSEFVQFSTFYGNIKPTFYLQKRSENNKRLSAIRKLDEALTVMLYELDKSQTFGQANAQSIKQLNTAIKQFELQKESKHNIAFRTKLVSAVSQLLISKKDFKTLETYCIKVFKELSNEKYFTRSNHDVKLQLLRYICNALFINKKHTEALNYSKVFYAAIEEHNKLLYDKNIFFYYNALANNYSVIDPQKAVLVLQEAKKNKAIINHPSHLSFVYFNLAGAYFELKQPKIGLKHILAIINHDVFTGLSDAFKIQILIIEILLRIELQDKHYALKQTTALLKLHHKTLNLPDFILDVEFLKLLKLLISKYDFEKNKATDKLLQNFSKIHGQYYVHGNINYEKWLKEHLI